MPEVRLVVLGSSSSGNATLVETEDTSVLVDAGFSCRELTRRISSVGSDVGRLQAIILTHEHTDHVRGARVLARRHGVPVYATPGTARAAGPMLTGTDLRPVRAWEPFPLAGSRAVLVPVPHDAAEPVAVRLDTGGRRLMVATDMGHFPWSLLEVGKDLDALVFESNHDEGMLHNGPYPVHLKRRIRGPRGHLSNSESAMALRVLLGPSTRGVLLGHLSRTNNTEELALETVLHGVPGPLVKDVDIRTTAPHRPEAIEL